MSVPHLRALEEALGHRSWRVADVLPGDGYRVSATWKLQRAAEKELLIDFDGLGPEGDVCLPLEQSYGCHVRGLPISLYFRRVQRSRELWEQELMQFVRSLDEVVLANRNNDPDLNRP